MSRLLGNWLVTASVLFASATGWGQESTPARSNWFDEPMILCHALESLGIRTTPWDAVAQGVPVYMCRELSVGPLFASPSLSLAFSVSGERAAGADTVSIAAIVLSPESKPEAKKQLVACIETFFQAISRSMPRALPAYIEKEQRYLGHLPYGTVSFFTTVKPKQEVLWFRLGRNP